MIEIVSIGAELLSGQIVNTNASYIARRLLENGYFVERVTTVPDKKDELKSVLDDVCKRARVVITTGGLGPTGDDITRHVMADFFDLELVYDETIAADLKKRYGESLQTIKDQATVLKGTDVLLNLSGTAPGFKFKKGQTTFFILPGVPVQMEEMLEHYVIPSLKKEVSPSYFEHSLYLCLLPEQNVDPYLRQLESLHPDIEIGICPSYGALSIYCRVKAVSKEEATEKLDLVVSAIRKQFRPYLFSERIGKIEYAVHEALIREMKTLACAESCTGGRIASRLSQISGASDYFLGSIVSYSNRLKTAVLNVNPETLYKQGSVCQETVIEMAKGTLDLTEADYVLAVSGIAGPTGGTPKKPVGTIWGAIGEKDKTIYSGKLPLRPNLRRDILIDYSSTYLLSLLWQLIQFGIQPFGEA